MPERDELISALAADNHAISMAMIRQNRDPLTDLPLPTQQLKLLLIVCASPPMTSQDLARRLGVSAPTLSGLVDRLMERRLIERTTVPEDRRVRVIAPTEAGQTLVRDVTGFGHGNAREILARLSIEELEALATGFAAVRRVIDAITD